MKEIIYIANARIPTEKAHGIQIMKMCEAFSNLGAHVELVVPNRGTPIKEIPFIYYKIKKSFAIKKIFCLDLVRFGKVGFFLQVLSFTAAAFFYVISRDADFIYSRDELPLYFLSFFKKNIFWETHTPKYNFLTRRLFKKTDTVVSITQGLKDFYIEKGISAGRILVAPDGVDLADFDINISKDKLGEDLALPKNKKIIGYVGKYKTMGKEKGVSDLIFSFSEVLKDVNDAFLLLVGINQNELSEVEKFFKDLGIKSENYKIVAHVPRKEVPYYLKASDLLVMNYPRAEHFEKYMSPLKLFEYMASGAPIISTDLPSVREVLNNKNSLLVPPGDVESLVEGIKNLLENNSIAFILSRQALEDIKKYTWHERTKKIYEKFV